MPTEIRRTSVPIVGRSRVLETSPPSISPLAIAATLLFILLHLVSSIMLGLSHVRPPIEPAALVALENGVKCSAEASALEPSLPNVWSLGSD